MWHGDFLKDCKMENKKFEETNYVHIEPNCHFYTSVDQIIRTIEIARNIKGLKYEYLIEPLIDYDYILTGLKNTLMNGYELKFNPNFNPDGNHHETGEKEL